MNLIKTIAPISIDNLKKYFEDQSCQYIIDYTNSQLQGKKLLTYLGNLEIPCDVDLSGCSEQQVYDLFTEYLHLEMVCTVPVLEKLVIDVILHVKSIQPNSELQYLVEGNQDILASWISKLDSLTLFNMYIINSSEFKQFVESHPLDETKSIVGINFVSVLKHEEFYGTYEKINQNDLKYYKAYFNEYMFKGNNLYSYWANGSNPLFLLTYGITEGLVDSKQYIEAKKTSLQELAHASPI